MPFITTADDDVDIFLYTPGYIARMCSCALISIVEINECKKACFEKGFICNFV